MIFPNDERGGDDEIDLNSALTIIAALLWFWVIVLYCFPGATT